MITHRDTSSTSNKKYPFLPDCQPIILVLAFWPRICDCTGSRLAT